MDNFTGIQGRVGKTLGDLFGSNNYRGAIGGRMATAASTTTTPTVRPATIINGGLDAVTPSVTLTYTSLGLPDISTLTCAQLPSQISAVNVTMTSGHFTTDTYAVYQQWMNDANARLTSCRNTNDAGLALLDINGMACDELQSSLNGIVPNQALYTPSVYSAWVAQAQARFRALGCTSNTTGYSSLPAVSSLNCTTLVAAIQNVTSNKSSYDPLEYQTWISQANTKLAGCSVATSTGASVVIMGGGGGGGIIGGGFSGGGSGGGDTSTTPVKKPFNWWILAFAVTGAYLLLKKNKAD